MSEASDVLALLSGSQLAEVRDGPDGTVLLFSPAPLAAPLGAAGGIAVTLAGQALHLRPWGGGEARPLGHVAAGAVLTLLGAVADEAVFAARPRAGEVALAGGVVALPGGPVAVATGAGVAISVQTLRAVAAERAGAALRGVKVTDLRARLDAVMRFGVHPPLATAGFRVGKALSVRIAGGCAQFVSLAVSRFASPVSLGFELTLGVAFGTFAAKSPTVASLIAEGMPALLRPLASLWGRDMAGYAVTPGGDDAALAAQLRSDVAGYALPWFARIATPEAMIGVLAAEDEARGGAGNAMMIGMLHAKAGRVAEARAAFGRAPGPREAIAATAARFGITLT